MENQERTKLELAKEMVKQNWKPFAIGVVLTGITFIVTKRLTMRYFAGIGIRQILIKDSVFLIQTCERHQGPPSWMVRCKETGNLFRSQEQASRAMSLNKGHLSMHLNGARNHVGGYTFERVAIEVPRGKPYC